MAAILPEIVLTTVTFDEKIFKTEVSNITSLHSRRPSAVSSQHSRRPSAASSQQSRRSSGAEEIHRITKHVDLRKRLQLEQNKRSAFNSTKIDRAQNAKSVINKNENGRQSNMSGSNQNDTVIESESEEEYNFSSDEDESPQQNPYTDMARNIGHTSKNVEKDITVQTYRKACRRLDIVPHSAIARALVEPEMTVRYGCLGPEGTKACAIALVYNDRVCELDLTGNNMGDRGIEYIAEVISYNSYLTSITLCQNAITVRGLEELCSEVSKNRYISHLDVSWNDFGDNGAQCISNMLKKNDTLHDLNLSHNSLREKGGIILGEALGENCTLEILDLSWNHIREKGAVGLTAGLKKNKGLKDLRLGWNGFYLPGCTAFIEAFENNRTLERLDLSNNRINVECVHQLLNGLRRNKALTALNLNMNPIGTDGAMAIMLMLQECSSCKLTELNIESQTVCHSFINTIEKIQESGRKMDVVYGTVIEQRNDVVNADDHINDDPLIVLMEYMKQNNMRLFDLFNSLDADGSKSLSYDEFRQGLMDVNLPLSSQSLDKLISDLDSDGDGEVDFAELMEGQKEFRRRIIRIQANKSNNSEDNKFTRIQKKVKAVLQARQAVKNMKKLVAQRKGSIDAHLALSSEAIAASAANIIQVPSGNNTRRNSIRPDNISEEPEVGENNSSQSRRNSMVNAAVALFDNKKPMMRKTITR